MEKPNLLSASDAAEYLGVRPSTLQLWREKNTGPNWIRVGRLVKYRREALDKYLADGERVLADRGAPVRTPLITILGGAHATH